jgi:hypothetical protein
VRLVLPSLSLRSFTYLPRRNDVPDPYIRLLLWEGVRSWWRSSLASWFTCPSPLSAPSYSSSSQVLLSQDQDGDLSSVVCPQTWASETHQITCARTFPPSLGGGGEEGGEHEIPELNTKEYYGPIRGSSSPPFSLSSLSPSSTELTSAEREQMASSLRSFWCKVGCDWLLP